MTFSSKEAIDTAPLGSTVSIDHHVIPKITNEMSKVDSSLLISGQDHQSPTKLSGDVLNNSTINRSSVAQSSIQVSQDRNVIPKTVVNTLENTLLEAREKSIDDISLNHI